MTPLIFRVISFIDTINIKRKLKIPVSKRHPRQMKVATSRRLK